MAILLVLLSHLTPGRNSDQGLRSLVYKVADLGWSGVDLFFVLSGFLITGILVRELESPRYFRNFYARRALRIFPLYYAVLAFSFLLLPSLASACARPSLGWQLPYWLYFANYTQPAAQGGCYWFGHFWSLAVEEQFYLIWPAVICLAGPRRARRICAAVVVGALLFRGGAVLSGASWSVTFQWLPARADALAAGSLVALSYSEPALRRRFASASAPALLLATVPLAWVGWFHRGTLVFRSEGFEAALVRTLLPSLLSVFFAALLVQAIERPRLGRLLDGAVLRAVARYSYGIYVFHFAMMPLFDRWFGSLTPWQFFLAAGSASFAVAALSYHFFERPFLAIKDLFRDPALPANGVAYSPAAPQTPAPAPR